MEKSILESRIRNLPAGRQGPKLRIFSLFALLLLLLFSFLISHSSSPKAHAQIGSLGIATYLPVTDSKVEEGDIIVSNSKGYSKSTIPYDTRVAGVVTLKPAVILKTDASQKGVPVIGSGVAYVKVTGVSGPIKKGDFITTSKTPGTGMKAEDTGFIIGSAMDDATFRKPDEIKQIQIFVNPRHIQAGIQLGDIFKLGRLSLYEKPAKILQYIMAGIITIVTFGAGFLIFAKTVNTGMEALGRNPLAGRMIQVSILFNIILIVVILVAGTGLAYLVIRL